MLQEIAITPTAFAVACQSEHGRHLYEIKSLLLPYIGDTPLVISNLNNGEWSKTISKMVSQIQDTSLRNLAQGIVVQLETRKMLVPRFGELLKDLNVEEDCIKEIVATSKQSPIRTVIASCTSEDIPTVCIQQLPEEFDEDLCSNPRNVPRSTAHQVKILELLARYSDWMIIRFPYVLGGSDDEIVTVIQLIKLSLDSLDDSERVRRSFQIQLSPSQIKQKSVENVQKLLKEEFGKWYVCIQVGVSREAFRNREILFGTSVKSGSKMIKQARWRLSMPHVAVLNDRAGEVNDWTFQGHVKASRRYQEIKQIGIKLV